MGIQTHREKVTLLILSLHQLKCLGLGINGNIVPVFLRFCRYIKSVISVFWQVASAYRDINTQWRSLVCECLCCYRADYRIIIDAESIDLLNNVRVLLAYDCNLVLLLESELCFVIGNGHRCAVEGFNLNCVHY